MVYLLTYCAIFVFLGVIICSFFGLKGPNYRNYWGLYPLKVESGNDPGQDQETRKTCQGSESPRTEPTLMKLTRQLPSLLFLSTVRQRNRNLWSRLLFFHYGLVLVAGTVFLLLVSFMPGIGPRLKPLITMSGMIGLILGLIGSVGLWTERMGHQLRPGPTRQTIREYGEMFAWLIAFCSGFICHLFIDPGFVLLREYLKHLLRFDLMYTPPSSLLNFEITIFSILLLYTSLKQIGPGIIRWSHTREAKLEADQT
ncbi:hypothetical protein JXQ70_02640 [bacterium]|nr:hypothetical protein [bacterium]